MSRRFEKISKKEFEKEYICSIQEYEELELPTRGSKFSAGYDFHAPYRIVLEAGKCIKIPTLIKADMEEDEVLLIDVRSSLGFKHNVRLANTIGVGDKDYYNNPDNEGHIFIKLYNPNNYNIVLEQGDRFAQGIFIKYLITEDDTADKDRMGGIGSTGK